MFARPLLSPPFVVLRESRWTQYCAWHIRVQTDIGYSTLLREDHGWRKEPDNVAPSTAEMQSVLMNVTDLRIRGDAFMYSRAGYGQEAVYINNITLYKKRSLF